MIKITNLTKIFFSPGGDKISIYKEVNFSLKKGEFVAIMGESGSGKTTLLNLISGLDLDYSGDISVGGSNLKSFSPAEITDLRGKKMSYIFQDFNLIETLTVAENIDLIFDINHTKRRFETSEILAKVGLKGKENIYPFTLSGGEKQRLAIARAFVAETDIILADELTGSLDEKNANIAMELLLDLWKLHAPTIILITHSPQVAKFAEKIYHLQNKNLIAC